MNRVKKVLKIVKLSQVDLAKEIDISTNAMNGICANRTQPSLKRLFEIAEVLNCSIYDLIEPNGKPSVFGEHDEDEVLKRLKRLEDDFEALKVEMKALKG